MNQDLIEKKIKGVLIGCAYGDAMGMPTENMSREWIMKQYPQGIKEFLPSLENGAAGRDLLAGEVTDDTINTLILLQSLVYNHGIPKADIYIRELRMWMKEHPSLNEVIVGRSTKRAIEAIDKGEDMSQTGLWGTTNGASMKIAPIGIISSYKNMDELIENVIEICYPTHNTQIAIQGACVIAALISYAMHGGTLKGIWNIAYQTIDAVSKKGLRSSGPKLKNRIQAIQHDLKTTTKEEMLTLLADFYGTGIETIETIPAVLAVLELGEGEPIQVGQITAALGGDTDTIGAIACAIAGALNPNFPKSIISQLETVNQIDFTALTSMILPYANC